MGGKEERRIKREKEYDREQKERGGEEEGDGMGEGNRGPGSGAETNQGMTGAARMAKRWNRIG